MAGNRDTVMGEDRLSTRKQRTEDLIKVFINADTRWWEKTHEDA